MIYTSYWYDRHYAYGAMVMVMILRMRVLSYAYGPCAIVVPMRMGYHCAYAAMVMICVS